MGLEIRNDNSIDAFISSLSRRLALISRFIVETKELPEGMEREAKFQRAKELLLTALSQTEEQRNDLNGRTFKILLSEIGERADQLENLRDELRDL